MSLTQPDPTSSTSSAPRTVSSTSECGVLRSVIIGTPECFVLPEPINKKQHRYPPGHPEAPTVETIQPEVESFRAALEARGVEVLQPGPVDGVPDQLTPRDIGFVIGDTFVLANMATECRREEWRGIASIIDEMPPEQVLRVPNDVVVEGGDIIVDRGVIYVGISERTTPDGAAWMEQTFGDAYTVVPIPLRSHDADQDILHLDCAFVPAGPDHALIYPEAFVRMPDEIADRYTFIEATREEQQDLQTNVLNIAPDCVISREVSTRLNDAMRAVGLDVIALRFRETPKMGGSVRCASLPIWREPLA